MLGHANRPHSGTAAAVRDAERLVQIQMAHIRANESGQDSPTCAFILAPSM